MAVAAHSSERLMLHPYHHCQQLILFTRFKFALLLLLLLLLPSVLTHHHGEHQDDADDDVIDTGLQVIATTAR